MILKDKNVWIIGSEADLFNLEHSYKRAFEEIGFEAKIFDLQNIIYNKFKFPSITGKFSLFHKPSIHAANVQLSKALFEHKPQLVFVICNAPIMPGTIIYAKSLGIKIVLVWPDTPVNIDYRFIENIKLYDFVASYSSTILPYFQKLGAQNVKWIPLAADKHIHYKKIDHTIKPIYDVLFVGNYRPERAADLLTIQKHFPNIKIKIWGKSWETVKDKTLQKCITPEYLLGQEMAAGFQKALININRIDITNYPAANMRFFEIPISGGGVQLSSLCLELQNMYKEKEHILFYQDENEMLEKIELVLQKPNLSVEMSKNAQMLTENEHTYTHRVKEILENI